VPVSVRAAAQQRKQRLFSDNGCRASSFGGRTAEPVRQHSAAHGACDRLHAARRVLGASAAGGSIDIGSEVLIALIIAALLLQLRPSAAGSGGMVRMVLSVLPVYPPRHGAHPQMPNLRPSLIQARPRPEETHRVPGTRMRDFVQIGNCTRWAVLVLLDVQRALASVPFRKLARQMQSPPAAKAAHAKHSRRGNRALSTVGAR
jgi:hypothetical protein